MSDSQVSFLRLGITVFFAFAAIVALIVFSISRGGASGTDSDSSPYKIWGTLPIEFIEDTLAAYMEENDGVVIEYSRYDTNDFNTAFTTAVAQERGPDLVLLPHEQLLEIDATLSLIPYDTLSTSTYTNQFIDATNILLEEGGVLGVPFAVDPLVLFYNEDFAKKIFLATPPYFWQTLIEVTPVATQLDNDNILESGIALGTFENIVHAKRILSALLLQLNNPVVEYDVGTESEIATLKDDTRIEGALRFYTEFSNPTKRLYSWNQSIQSDREFFLDGKLLFYIAPGSEAVDLRRTAPTLSFGISYFPQPRVGANDVSTLSTAGVVWGFALPLQSDRKGRSYEIANGLSAVHASVENRFLPPALRRAYVSFPTDAPYEVLYRSSFISRAWKDRRPTDTYEILKEGINSVISGRLSIGQSIEIIDERLTNLYKAIGR